MSWIATYTGRQFFPLAPRPEDVHIVDIAHALSNQCRFSGHVRTFYSVAQHSVHVAHLAGPEYALWGLLHDAAEAYLVDLPKPLKHAPGLAAYNDAEAAVMAAVCTRFGLPLDMPATVKTADVAMLHAEARDLMNPCRVEWLDLDLADPAPVVPVSPACAKGLFLSLFQALTGEAA